MVIFRGILGAAIKAIPDGPKRRVFFATAIDLFETHGPKSFDAHDYEHIDDEFDSLLEARPLPFKPTPELADDAEPASEPPPSVTRAEGEGLPPRKPAAKAKPAPKNGKPGTLDGKPAKALDDTNGGES